MSDRLIIRIDAEYDMGEVSLAGAAKQVDKAIGILADTVAYTWLKTFYLRVEKE